MQRIRTDWFRRWLEIGHECERCGDFDDVRVHAPLRSGEVGSTGLQGIDMDVDPFSSGQESCRKARPHLTHFLGRMPRKRRAGWPSLLVTFLLATQEKSDSPSAGGRNALKLLAALKL